MIINIRLLSNNRFSISIICCIIICRSSIICRNSIVRMLSVINRFGISIISIIVSISIILFIGRSSIRTSIYSSSIRSCISSSFIISSISVCRSYSFRRIIISSSSVTSSIIILCIRIFYINIRNIIILRSIFRGLNSNIRSLSRISWSNLLIIRRSIYNSRSVISRRFNKNSIMRSCIGITIGGK